MLNRSASLAMSTSVLKALPGKFDIKKNTYLVFSIYNAFHWPNIERLLGSFMIFQGVWTNNPLETYSLVILKGVGSGFPVPLKLRTADKRWTDIEIPLKNEGFDVGPTSVHYFMFNVF